MLIFGTKVNEIKDNAAIFYTSENVELEFYSDFFSYLKNKLEIKESLSLERMHQKPLW